MERITIDRIKKHLDKKIGKDVNFKIRLFYITCVLGVLATVSQFVMTFYVGLPIISRISSSICMIFMIVFTTIAFCSEYNRWITVAIVGSLDLLLFPMMFFSSGGMYSGMPIYFLFGIAIDALLLVGSERIVLCILTLMIDSICIILGWIYPSMVIPFSATKAMGDILTTDVIAGIFLFIITMRTVDEFNKYYDQVNALNHRLDKLATTDSLTELYNRGYMLKYMDEMINNSISFHLGLFDIDNFKHINDTYGHATGDKLLKTFSLILSSTAEEFGGLAARYGGEEFVIVVPQISDEEMSRIGEIIRSEAEKKLIDVCDELVTVSGGLYKYLRGESVDDMIVTVDSFMYKAKRSGKNRIYARYDRLGEGGIDAY